MYGLVHCHNFLLQLSDQEANLGGRGPGQGWPVGPAARSSGAAENGKGPGNPATGNAHSARFPGAKAE